MRLAPLLLALWIFPSLGIAAEIPLSGDFWVRSDLRINVDGVGSKFSASVAGQYTATLDTTALEIRDFSMFGLQAATTVPPGFALEGPEFTVTRTIDPPGFDPPFTETLGTVRGAFEFLSFDAMEPALLPSVHPLGPQSLRSGTFRLFETSSAGEYTAFVDGAEFGSRMARGTRTINAWFQCSELPAPDCSLRVRLGVFPPAGAGFNIEELFGVEPEGTSNVSRISGSMVIPEPSTAFLTALGLLALASGKRRRG